MFLRYLFTGESCDLLFSLRGSGGSLSRYEIVVYIKQADLLVCAPTVMHEYT